MLARRRSRPLLLPVEEAEKAAAILKEEMEGAANFAVTLTADANIGDNWLDAK